MRQLAVGSLVGLGYPFLASSQELLVAQLTNQQLLSSEVKAVKQDRSQTALESMFEVGHF